MITSGGELSSRIKDNLTKVLEKIEAAASRSGRKSSDVRLVVVSKGQPVEVILAAIHAGVHIFGENYPEQAAPKIEALQGSGDVAWHMIGHIQSRKASLVCQYFDYVHSVDSVRLAEKLDHLAAENGKVIPVLLELNLGGEKTKSGWRLSDMESLDKILLEFELIGKMDHIRVEGLMTMPPLYDNPEQSRPFFKRLFQLKSMLQKRLPDVDWTQLSMGTSPDFEIAVEEGATFVRVGQAILGPRPNRY